MNLKSSNGEYRELEIDNPSVSIEDYIPINIKYPNLERYSIKHTKNEKTGLYEAILIRNDDDAEEMIKRLKKIHKISDPWDKDNTYFQKKLKKLLEEYGKDKFGNYYLLKKSDRYENKDPNSYLPEKVLFPDVGTYVRYSESMEEVKPTPNIKIEQHVIRQLKDMYDIHDPWDNEDSSFFDDLMWKMELQNRSMFSKIKYFFRKIWLKI
jgi:hypothetical protein